MFPLQLRDGEGVGYQPRAGYLIGAVYHPPAEFPH